MKHNVNYVFNVKFISSHTFSGLCAPGPGFMALSDGMLYREAIEKIGGLLSM